MTIQVTSEHIEKANGKYLLHPVALALKEIFSAADVYIACAYVWEYGKKKLINFSMESTEKIMSYHLSGKMEPFELQII